MFEILPCGSHFLLINSFEENHKFSNKNNHLPAWRKIENIFLPHVHDLNHLLEKFFCPDSNLRVKTMYESVKEEVLMRPKW